MYFITNSDGYIIAASKKLLENIGSKDICSIFSALNNRDFLLDEESKEIKINNSEYSYTKSNLLSMFGELKLYSLNSKEASLETEESIEYLKKIKEGIVQKDDDNFSIPPITKDETKTEKEEVVKKADDNIVNLIQDIEEIKTPKEENISKKELEKDSEKTDIPNKENKKLKEDIEEIDLVKDIEETVTPESEEKEVKENVEKIDLIESVFEKPELYANKSEEESNEVENKLEDIPETTIRIEELEKHLHKGDEVEEKKGALSKIKSKLFPWSNSNKEEIELEEESTNIDIDEKTLDDKNKDVELISTKDEENLKKENEQLANESLKILQDEDKKDDKKLDFIDTEIVEKQEEVIETNDDKKTLSNIENIDELKLFNIQDEKSSEINEEKIEEETQKPKQDKSEEELSKDELLLLKEIEEIDILDNKEEFKIIEEKNIKSEIKEVNINKPEKTENIDIVKNEMSNENKKVVSKQNFLYKIISMQVKSIDLEENAKKLSIDVSNYKLLLENFLDELDNYKNDLINKDESTISMLIDASELLSLNTITDKLKKLLKGDEKSFKEIELTSQLLKDKLNGKEIEIETDSLKIENPQKDNIIKKEEKKDNYDIVESENNNLSYDNIEKKLNDTNSVIKTKESSIENIETKDLKLENNIIDTEIVNNKTPNIPQEAIDITTPKDLLEKINSEKTYFNPDKAVNELNLPRDLILEFVNDFISQAKDHLSQLVDAYKQSDIKALQTTAHMLKGAASNLRLDPIAEVLFKIQKSNNLEESGELLKKFIAKLKGLELEVDNLEKEGNEN